jgi:hypothetical protein
VRQSTDQKTTCPLGAPIDPTGDTAVKCFIGGQQATNALEFAELALGTPPELWLGVEGESEEERAARLDAARDILTDDPTLLDAFDRVFRVAMRTPGAIANLRPLAPTARRLASARAAGGEVWAA